MVLLLSTLKRIVRHTHAKTRELLKKRPGLAKKAGVKARSSGWSKVEHEFLKTHGVCAACGGREALQVHHVKPFHLHPELELDPENLITLCMSGDLDCHLRIGHGGSFKCYNPDVREDCEFVGRGINREVIIKSAKEKRLV
jgi:5-methylcytosine-specific restriction protein A